MHSSVSEAMRAALDSGYGNPSSLHWAGAPAKATLEHGRRQVAGSEANNLALKGVFYARRGPTHVITTRIEHPSILAPCVFLERLGVRVTRLPVDGTGLVDPDDGGRLNGYLRDHLAEMSLVPTWGGGAAGRQPA